MALRPPQHAVDAPIVYVHQDDPAWDLDAIAKDQEAMAKAEADPSRHPVEVYHSGKSRYDLNAQYSVCGDLRCAAQYLDDSAWRFSIKRLGFEDYYRVQGVMAQNFKLGAAMACRLGVESIDGPGALPLHPTGRGLSDKDMQAIFDIEHPTHGVKGWLPVDLGTAVMVASAPLSDEEGKP